MKKKHTRKPLKMTVKDWAGFRALKDADIEKAAKTDPDTVLLSGAELKK